MYANNLWAIEKTIRTSGSAGIADFFPFVFVSAFFDPDFAASSATFAEKLQSNSRFHLLTSVCTRTLSSVSTRRTRKHRHAGHEEKLSRTDWQKSPQSLHTFSTVNEKLQTTSELIEEKESSTTDNGQHA